VQPVSLDFYTTPGRVTDLSVWDDRLGPLVSDPIAAASMVQGLVLHNAWAVAYDVEVAPDRQPEIQIRGAAAMLERVVEIDDRPLTEPRPADRRLFGNCRDFSVLTVALLRRAGVPSRARCGFGSYFETGKWVDHWIVEHWNGDRWVRLDAQLDDLQTEITGVTDRHDLDDGRFLAGGEAWQRYRRGEVAGDRFGIFDQWGPWMASGNLGRDFAALNKVEMLPWDEWGRFGGVDTHPDGDAWFDDLAEVTAADDLDAIRDRYQSDDDLRMQGRVLAYVPELHEVDVSHLV
jgi:hypothetical protein